MTPWMCSWPHCGFCRPSPQLASGSHTTLPSSGGGRCLPLLQQAPSAVPFLLPAVAGPGLPQAPGDPACTQPSLLYQGGSS